MNDFMDIWFVFSMTISLLLLLWLIVIDGNKICATKVIDNNKVAF